MNIPDLISSINTTASSNADFGDKERAELLAATSKLLLKLETPREQVFRIVFAPIQAIVLRIAIDMKLFDAAATLVAKGAGIQTENLASELQADPAFIARIMRFLVAMDIFNLAEAGKYTSTSFSNAYVTASPLAQGAIHMTSQNDVLSTLPAYFALNGYKNPSNAYNGPFQYARNTKLHCFDWLATQPRLQQAFNVVMSIPRSTHGKRWFECFPCKEKLIVNEPEDVLLVDIGGGKGHDLISFKNYFPDIKGRLVLQEVPTVINSITEPLPSKFEALAHNFFDEQTVKGAKAYYLANVLHDWPDMQALQILRNIREAMGERSLLLACEAVIREGKVSVMSASADLMMMAGFSALERTEEQFKVLMEEAGFVVAEVWVVEGGEERRLFECVVNNGSEKKL